MGKTLNLNLSLELSEPSPFELCHFNLIPPPLSQPNPLKEFLAQ